jgi:hypothetical protein
MSTTGIGAFLRSSPFCRVDIDRLCSKVVISFPLLSPTRYYRDGGANDLTAPDRHLTSGNNGDEEVSNLETKGRGASSELSLTKRGKLR